MPKKNIQQSSQTRVFTIEDRAGPANSPVYQFLQRAMGVSWPQGDFTAIRIPDPNQYGRFITISRTKGQAALPTLALEARMTRDLSDMLKLVRKGCDIDIQLHVGVCEDPRDFNGGWEKIHVLEGAGPTGYDTTELGALDGDQNVPTNETVPFSGLDYYEIKRVIGSELGATEIVQEIVDVIICDSRQCGECGLPSNGCLKIFAITKSAGGSPGLPAELISSDDGGMTLNQMIVTSLGANEDPNAIMCVGTYLVIVSEDSESLHYALISEVLDGTAVFAEVTSGFVATKGPQAIYSVGRTFTWIVGEAGYIYFSSDITAGVEVQSAGSVTVQNLNAIHGIDESNIVAVGNLNAVIFTEDGGETWASVTGPAVGVNLKAVWMRSELEWFVGTENGKLYYTRDGGASWVEKTFSGSGTGAVYDISFSTPTVGYMAHASTTPRGRILRTIDGGHSWYILPEQAGLSLPLNDRIGALAACGEDPNTLFAGGLADNATDGILIKVA